MTVTALPLHMTRDGLHHRLGAPLTRAERRIALPGLAGPSGPASPGSW